MSQICHKLSLNFKMCAGPENGRGDTMVEEMAEETKLKTHTFMQSGCIKI
jgi:hypothetical protein